MAFDLRLLGAFGRGLASGDSPVEQIANGLNSIGDARVAQGQRNKTMEFLSQSPEISKAVQDQLLTPQEGLKLYFAQQAETKKAQSPDNRYKAVGSRLFDLQTQDWISPPAGAGGDEELGLNLVYGQDTEGNTVGFQPSKSGGLRPVTLPPGVRLTPGTSAVDLGTSIGIRENRSGDIIRQVPKDLRGAEREKALGDSEGKSRASAAGDYQSAQNALSLVQDLRTDPNRQWGTGKTSAGNWISASPGYDYQNKVDQAKAGAFATAIQQMRGLGALSNAEGDVATRAVTRMDTATSEGAFLDALDDYEKIIRQGMDRAGRLLQGGQQQPAQGGANRTATGVQWSID